MAPFFLICLSFPHGFPLTSLTGPIFPFVMVVCCNKVMGAAVVLQIEQKMERQEIGYMERNKKGANGFGGRKRRKGETCHDKDEYSDVWFSTYKTDNTEKKKQQLENQDVLWLDLRLDLKFSSSLQDEQFSSCFIDFYFLLRSQRSAAVQVLWRGRLAQGRVMELRNWAKISRSRLFKIKRQNKG